MPIYDPAIARREREGKNPLGVSPPPYRLYGTLAVLVIGIATQIGLAFWRAGAHGVIAILTLDAVQLCILVPLGILACFFAAKLLQTSFGTIGSAILKLATLVVVADAISMLPLIFPFGLLLTFVVYVILLAWLFELEAADVFYFALIMWVVHAAGVSLSNLVTVAMDLPGQPDNNPFSDFWDYLVQQTKPDPK